MTQQDYEKHLKSTLATVLKDLSEAGTKDPEAMWLIGSLATKFIEDSKAKDWVELKSRISPTGFELTIAELQKQIYELQKKGKIKPAYAAQAIAISIAAEKLKDKESKKGNELLNGLIANAIVYFNSVNAKSKAN